MKRKLFWMIPVFNGIVVGLILWAMNDFDVTRVLGQWAIIAVALSVYVVIIAGIPTMEPRVTAQQKLTPVQRRYIEITKPTPAK